MASLTHVRQKFARQIIGYNVGIIVLSVVFYLTGGLDYEDFSNLVSILVPMSTVYLGALFQFLGKTLIEQDGQPNEENNEKIADNNVSLIRWIIFVHFALLIAVIVAKVTPVINFKEMKLFLALIEGAFGAYIGYIINSLFNHTP